jgi:hypothetical protein
MSRMHDVHMRYLAAKYQAMRDIYGPQHPKTVEAMLRLSEAAKITEVSLHKQESGQ